MHIYRQKEKHHKRKEHHHGKRKKLSTTAQELPDETLNQVSGGTRYDEETKKLIEEARNTKKEVLRSDYQGRPTQWKWISPTGKITIFHYECPTCKRWMHFGTLGALYCDPCDEYYLTDSSQMACRKTYFEG